MLPQIQYNRPLGLWWNQVPANDRNWKNTANIKMCIYIRLCILKQSRRTVCRQNVCQWNVFRRNVTSAKCSGCQRNIRRWNVCRWNVRSAKCLSIKCLSTKCRSTVSACVRAILACVVAQIVLYDVVCYLASSRNNIPKHVIIKSSVISYDEDAVIRAKYEISRYVMRKT